MTEPVKGDPEDLCRILEALDERNDLNIRQAKAVENLADVVDELHDEVVALRAQLTDRPTKAQAEHKRRRVLVSMALFGLALVWAGDAHSEACGPGSRAEAVISEAVDPAGPPLSREYVQDLINEKQPTALCDASFPIHAHKAESDWPTSYALVGLGGYAVIGGLLWLWQRGPRPDRQRRWNDSDDDPTPEEHHA